MRSRVELLAALAGLREPLDTLTQELSAHGWDSPTELFVLHRHDIAAVLRRFVEGELKKQDVTDWANAIEGREDVGYEPGSEPLIRDAIYELANPELTQAISSDVAAQWLGRLK